MRKESYTAASAFPVKVFFNKELMESLTERKIIPPIHVQLNPTNRCNLNCSFCSCSARDKSIEMPFEKIIETMRKFKELGCKSTTLTGGGEVLMHSNVNVLIWAIHEMGIEIGLVTNGILLDKLSNKALNCLVWCRVSLGDHRKFEEIEAPLKRAVKRGKKVDFAFSYVVGEVPNLLLIQKMVEFANEHDFTHVRLVNDIFIADKLGDQMEAIKNCFKDLGIDDSKVIYQDRGTWTRGSEKCWISLLKPVIDAGGNLRPCCGSQYMFKNPKHDYEGEMGSVEEIEEIWASQRHFDGSQCDKCYYSHYNELMDILLGNVKHQKFV